MERKLDINRLRNGIRMNIGRRVKIREHKGRNKIDVAEGIIAEIYPCVFLIKVGTGTPDTIKTLSFSYTDLLTKDVELVLCSRTKPA